MLLELHHSLHMPGVSVSHVMTDSLRTGLVEDWVKQPRWLVGEAGAAEDTGDGLVDVEADELAAGLGDAEDEAAADDAALDAALDVAADDDDETGINTWLPELLADAEAVVDELAAAEVLPELLAAEEAAADLEVDAAADVEADEAVVEEAPDDEAAAVDTAEDEDETATEEEAEEETDDEETRDGEGETEDEEAAGTSVSPAAP